MERHTIGGVPPAADHNDGMTAPTPPPATPADAPPPQVWPTLRARDARALIRFYVEAFGFEETVVWGSEPDGGGEFVVHAQPSWPLGGGIMLGSAPAPGAPGGPEGDAWSLEPGTFGAYVVTDAPDALFAQATVAGATVLHEPHETGYGSRDFAVTDPEGNRWSFGTYRGEPRTA